MASALLIVSALLITQGLALPTPQTVDGSGALDVCSLDQHDPATWAASGASAFMNNWFSANGTDNWLHNMDQATTTIPGFDSTLDCKPLGGNTCPAPVTPCQDFTPPELRVIRIAATNAHDFFTQAHEKLQDTAILNILNIDQIIADFAPDAGANGFNYVNAVAAGFFIASPLASLFGGPLGAILGLIGGALNFANAVNGPEPPIDSTDEWQRILSGQLGTTFSSGADSVAALNSKLLGGDDDIDLDGIARALSDAGLVSTSEDNSITKIFSTGAFLADIDQNKLGDALDAGLARIKQSLVAGLLRAQNFYVHIDTTRSEGDCNDTGSRFINGQCAIISKRTKPNGDGDDSEPVDKDILSKLDDPNANYNVDVNEMYQNAIDCNGGQLDTTLTFQSGLPKCFWSLPILKTDGPSVCSLIPDDLASAQGYSAGLGLTRNSCYF